MVRTARPLGATSTIIRSAPRPLERDRPPPPTSQTLTARPCRRPGWLEIREVLLRERLIIPAPRRQLVRSFDLAVSLTALVLAFPLLVVLTVLISATSPGAPLYVQWRIGRWGRLFPCLKLRSMHHDADERLQVLLASDPVLATEWAANHKLRNDPRVTTVGRFLRRTNLDELPQLLNVALGQMSIVGPRPIVTDEALRYGTKLPAVLSVRPGLTGLWQVSGRNGTTYQTRVDLDYEYVTSPSLSRDLRICLQTAWQTIRPHSNGAC